MWHWLRRLLRIPAPHRPLTHREMAEALEHHCDVHQRFMDERARLLAQSGSPPDDPSDHEIHLRIHAARERAIAARDRLAAKPQTDELLEQIKRDHARNVPDTVDERGEYVLETGHTPSPELRKILETGLQPEDCVTFGDVLRMHGFVEVKREKQP